MSKNPNIQARALSALSDRLGDQKSEPKKSAGAAPAKAEPAPKRPARAARMDDIRLSVGVAPKVYHRLVNYTNELAMKLGLPRIPHVQVIRALLEELESNPELSNKIAQRVTSHYDKR